MDPQAAQGAINFVFCMLTDAASVEKNDIRLAGFLNKGIALAAQGTHDQFAIQNIHLAANGLDIKLAV
jgi:hypothetical protein